ncbi:3'-5' exoribonuclease 1 [Plakobranchus ocellatus]|uniref:3'-5' exoribonuclease 1 n=1 Tax=Plakobranchus ocellatus TaxID=259542 RepID=A0AAV4DWB1_9GAST|nr:3'-5' exoribonuclease 1 [Plakobranchus ocellatus]
MDKGQSSSWGHAALSLLGLTSDTHKMDSSLSLKTPAALPKPKPRHDIASGSSFGDDLTMKLSRINGAINKMTKDQMQEKLSSIGLNTCGVKDVLKKRLKNYYKRQRTAQCNRALTEDEVLKFDYLVVIDFEATCSETNDNFVHEIIEFPAVLVDARGQVICDDFQRFCKPRLNPKLTPFCTSLTGITQTVVDQAQYFPEVLAEFEEWMASHKLGTEHKFAVLTDGPWDMSRFLKTQTEISNIPFPRWARQWINLRKAYTAFYGCGKVNLQHMLQDLGMTFEGRPHCGLDDSRNIAAIALRLLMDGCIMRINEYQREEKPAGRGEGGSGGTRGSSIHQPPHRSPPKSRMTQKRQQGREGQSIQGNETEDIPQEGENIEDLLHYLKLQKS